MSLLLNALKKVEEGETPEQKESADADSSDPSQTQSPASSEGEGAASPALSTAPPKAATSLDDIVDLDSIVEEDEKPESHAPDEKKHRKDVDAIRVFGAGEEETGGGLIRKLIFSLLGIAVVGGGGYGLLISGVVPGLNMSIFGGLGSDAIIAVAPTEETGRFEAGSASAELTLLPIPVVDVQSEVDFADLRLPENRPEIIGDDEYKKKIAIYTGYDIEKERKRIIEESGILNTAEEAGDFGLLGDSVTEDGEDAVIADEDIIVRTANASRVEKARIDSTTSSEINLNIVINNGEEQSNQAPAVVAQAEVMEADVMVAPSEDGMERSKLMKQAQRLYYNGSYSEAEVIYRNILRSTPQNMGAMQGLALIATATGRYQLAAATYLNILDYYPDNPTAIAELTNLRVGNDVDGFYETESILKNLLGKSTIADSRVYFTLGNLYASYAKWFEAQQAYFEAYTRNSNNPDYSYNLAVVFDYLNKPQLAVRYYQEALVLSDKDILIGFDRSQVKKRINDIN